MELVVVTPEPSPVYSGMIPGVLAGHHRLDEARIDAARLARRAGGALLVDRVVRIDYGARTMLLAGGDALRFDLASLDVGSTVRGVEGAGPPEGTVTARDVEGLLERVERLGSDATSPDVIVVGGGAAGVEVAAALRWRLGRRFPDVSVTLLEGTSRVMGGYAEEVSRRARRALESRAVRVRTESPVQAVEEDDGTAVVLPGGERLTGDLVVWAAGAAAPPLARASELPTDDGGFVRVGRTLQVSGHPHLFAVGDCASLEGHELPKAGVHAVRQAPVLFDNLRASVASRSADGRAPRERAEARRHDGPTRDDLRRYEPQTDFLTLLNLGDGTALGTKWGWTAEGRWVRWLKDAIDRRFVERFRG